MPNSTHGEESQTAPPDQPAYRPFPEVAKAIRAQSSAILAEWRGRTLISMPELAALTVKEFMNSIPAILSAMADALESNDPPDLERLMETAPDHGFQRSVHDYNLLELFAEERVLRRVIVSKVEESLKRRCTAEEAAALHTMIDIMLQQGVLALVKEQKQELRQGAEAQLTHLSFLSHDLANTFFVMSCNLETIKHQLSKLPDMSEAVKRVGASLAIIKRTRQGMYRLLEHESLRKKSKGQLGVASVKLVDIVDPIVTMATTDMSGSGPLIQVDIEPDAMASTNADLLTIILQNLIGNAVKYSSTAAAQRSTGGDDQDSSKIGVRVQAQRHIGKDSDAWVISVIDDGPGIAEDQLDTLFNAFEKMPKPGEKAFSDEKGFGLGLAIASQAARLLSTKIEVKTKVGEGSTFSVRVPNSPKN